ncbi:hypothetical protein L873DRAFT_1824599, partial [Choiromyces venosus 120613-1]
MVVPPGTLSYHWYTNSNPKPHPRAVKTSDTVNGPAKPEDQDPRSTPGLRKPASTSWGSYS